MQKKIIMKKLTKKAMKQVRGGSGPRSRLAEKIAQEEFPKLSKK
jgi:hypothetical protein